MSNLAEDKNSLYPGYSQYSESPLPSQLSDCFRLTYHLGLNLDITSLSREGGRKYERKREEKRERERERDWFTLCFNCCLTWFSPLDGKLQKGSSHFLSPLLLAVLKYREGWGLCIVFKWKPSDRARPPFATVPTTSYCHKNASLTHLCGPEWIGICQSVSPTRVGPK